MASATLVGAAVVPAAARWRRGGVVLGAMLGLFAGFNGLFFATLPFLMRPIGLEFGWGRADVSMAAVLSMLGVTLAAPLVGRLFDRFGVERVIAVSVLLLALALWAMGRMPPQLGLYAALSLAIGIAGAGTTMAGYLAVLPRWFDRHLGLALGLAGLGLGLGVVLNGWLVTLLIERLGWRDAYSALAGVALVLGLLALALLSPRSTGLAAGDAQQGAAANGPSPGAAEVAGSSEAAESAYEGRRAAPTATARADTPGLTLREAVGSARFWLLAITTFLVPCAILGSAVHAPSLYADRGMTPAQAALGAGVAGIGAMLARIAVGALLDRFHAPRVAVVVFVLGAAGVGLGSVAHTLPLLVLGSLLSGIAIGAEGDLVPYLVRRYFGLRAFGAVFGSVFAAYAFGGVVGPWLYGFAFDRLGGYAVVMQAAALLAPLGRYRFEAAPRVATGAST